MAKPVAGSKDKIPALPTAAGGTAGDMGLFFAGRRPKSRSQKRATEKALRKLKGTGK